MTVLVIDGLEPRLRAEFADVCLEVGPDAPTLCEGWTTRDLAIHMELIERRWDSWLAIPVWSRVAPIDRAYGRLVDRERSRPWEELVDRVRSGPEHRPAAHAVAARPDDAARVHHPHRGRSTGERNRCRRTDDVQQMAWNRLAGLAKRMISISDPYGLELRDLAGSTMPLSDGRPDRHAERCPARAPAPRVRTNHGVGHRVDRRPWTPSTPSRSATRAPRSNRCHASHSRPSETGRSDARGDLERGLRGGGRQTRARRSSC